LKYIIRVGSSSSSSNSSNKAEEAGLCDEKEELLLKMGGKLWEMGSMRRVYFELDDDLLEEACGLKLQRYGSGGIKQAWLDGDLISNSEAWGILEGITQVKLFFDARARKWHFSCPKEWGVWCGLALETLEKRVLALREVETAEQKKAAEAEREAQAREDVYLVPEGVGAIVAESELTEEDDRDALTPLYAFLESRLCQQGIATFRLGGPKGEWGFSKKWIICRGNLDPALTRAEVVRIAEGVDEEEWQEVEARLKEASLQSFQNGPDGWR
jgi:hypothetical protein